MLFMKGTAQFYSVASQVRLLAYCVMRVWQRSLSTCLTIKKYVKTLSYILTGQQSQLYIKGEFIGGSDIMTEMAASGELKALLDEAGVTADE